MYVLLENLLCCWQYVQCSLVSLYFCTTSKIKKNFSEGKVKVFSQTCTKIFFHYYVSNPIVVYNDDY